MSNYNKLKEVLRLHRKYYYSLLNETNEKIDLYHKLKKNLESIDFSDIKNEQYDKLFRIQKYFPDDKEDFDYLKQLISYSEIIDSRNMQIFNFDEFYTLICNLSSKYGIPPASIISEIKKSMDVSKRLMTGLLDFSEIENIRKENNYGLRVYVKAICQTFAESLRKDLLRTLDKTYQIDLLDLNKKSYKEKIALIEKYDRMFSDTELLTKFNSEEDLNEFLDYFRKMLDKKDYLEIEKDVQLDQNKEEVIIEDVTFDNLDLTIFNEEEKDIIEELREIIEDEELDNKEDPFSDVEISLEVRNLYYKEASINDILLDTKYLLNNIYNNKDEVIKIFRLIINKYRKYSLNIIRSERVIELLKLKNDFNNIISFINKTFTDRELAFNNEKNIKEYIDYIDANLIPITKEMIDNDLDYDELFDNEVEVKIEEYKSLVRKWKKEISSTYSEEIEKQSNKEDADNLVFCINDVDISQDGFDKEFVGTVEALESRTSQDLKKRPGRRGMSRIRKTSENGKEKDFIEYLETKYKVKLHFVPYRYSSDPNYRTGLIKFEPSENVKEFLEDYYGLSNQSAYYGIFQIISAIGANHNDYYYFENYILNNYQYIEEIARLFSSDNPDYNKLVNVIDEFLDKKKNTLKSIQNTMN